MINLQDYIYVENILTTQESKSFLDNMTSSWYPHTWTDNKTGEEIVSQVDPFNALPSKDLCEPIMEKIWDSHDKYCAKVNREKLINNLSYPRINRYGKDQKMEIHYDHITSLFDGSARGIPVLSFILMLNSDYKGGELVFDFGGTHKHYKLNTGDVIMWPSVFLYPHSVKPVTQGQRYSMVIWGW
jgi:predicted 2-oxoglutarate/Fe(II)-dependent dioxygenase YbiX